MGSGSDEVEQLRRQADQSREDLGETVGALAYKADVKNRGKEVITDKKEVIMEKVETLKSKLPGAGEGEGGIGETIKSKLPSGEDVGEKIDALKSKVPGVGDAAASIGDATPSKDDIKGKVRSAAEAANDHPVAVTVGAAAAGLVAGLALPETDLEREKIGPAAQSAREQIQTGAQEAVQHAKQVARDAATSAAEAVKQAGQEHGGKLGEIAQGTAEKAREQVKP